MTKGNTAGMTKRKPAARPAAPSPVYTITSDSVAIAEVAPTFAYGLTRRQMAARLRELGCQRGAAAGAVERIIKQYIGRGEPSFGQAQAMVEALPVPPPILLPALCDSTRRQQAAYFRASARRSEREQRVESRVQVLDSGPVLALPAQAGVRRLADMLDQVHHMDALSLLRLLPDDSIDCCVSSPPYWQLRDYNAPGQIGMEDTLQAFIEALVGLYREVRRVLKPTGTCFVNMGDTYSADRGYQVADNKHKDVGNSFGRDSKAIGLAPKQRCMIPARLAIALQDEGWWVRDEIIWHKLNPMPASYTDRTTYAHEMIYMLTKRPTYWYDQEAIREPARDWGSRDRSAMRGGTTDPKLKHHGLADGDFAAIGRNARSVWAFATEPSKYDHYAAFPSELPRRCIKAGCPATVCAVCGKPYERQTEIAYTPASKSRGKSGNGTFLQAGAGNKAGGWNDYPSMDKHVTTLGFAPSCDCHAATKPGVVLDPFMGSGTVALVARQLGRHFIGSDLNAAYVALCRERLRQPFEAHYIQRETKLPEDKADGQLALFQRL